MLSAFFLYTPMKGFEKYQVSYDLFYNDLNAPTASKSDLPSLFVGNIELKQAPLTVSNGIHGGARCFSFNAATG